MNEKKVAQELVKLARVLSGGERSAASDLVKQAAELEKLVKGARDLLKKMFNQTQSRLIKMIDKGDVGDVPYDETPEYKALDAFNDEVEEIQFEITDAWKGIRSLKSKASKVK